MNLTCMWYVPSLNDCGTQRVWFGNSVVSHCGMHPWLTRAQQQRHQSHLAHKVETNTARADPISRADSSFFTCDLRAFDTTLNLTSTIRPKELQV